MWLRIVSQKTSSNSVFPKCINVFFHIVRNDNGTLGYNQANLNSIVNYLNNNFNQNDFYFKNAGFDYMNSTVANNLMTNNVTLLYNNLFNVNIYFIL